MLLLHCCAGQTVGLLMCGCCTSWKYNSHPLRRRLALASDQNFSMNWLSEDTLICLTAGKPQEQKLCVPLTVTQQTATPTCPLLASQKHAFLKDSQEINLGFCCREKVKATFSLSTDNAALAKYQQPDPCKLETGSRKKKQKDSI